MFLLLGFGASGIFGAFIFTLTLPAPTAFNSAVASSIICCATSGALDVISTLKLTSFPLISILLTKPKVTISLVKPGYKTFDSAEFTISLVILIYSFLLIL